MTRGPSKLSVSAAFRAGLRVCSGLLEPSPGPPEDEKGKGGSRRGFKLIKSQTLDPAAEADLPYLLSLIVYVGAALAEIAGCFAFWSWLRLGRSPWLLAPGLLSLGLFAFLLTRIDSSTAGRAYAAYGGVYITASLLWMWAVERRPPDRWDLLGALICLAGAAVILFGRRAGAGA